MVGASAVLVMGHRMYLISVPVFTHVQYILTSACKRCKYLCMYTCKYNGHMHSGIYVLS